MNNNKGNNVIYSKMTKNRYYKQLFYQKWTLRNIIKKTDKLRKNQQLAVFYLFKLNKKKKRF